MIYKGCIYREFQRNRGRKSVSSRFRWVAEVMVRGKRHRFRTTNYTNATKWLENEITKLNNNFNKQHLII